MEKGKLTFTCDDSVLEQGFNWAKEQALVYAHENDLVGDWYEAALPQREAFCMRDVAHQAAGAHALGLQNHTKNMLLRFAQSISKSKDYCSFWEIDRHYRPCPVDYTNDNDFWYNLPANFDIIDCCYRMYLKTGDIDYVHHPDFVRFYELTMHEYVATWDINGDGILERKEACSRRGIPSYHELANDKTDVMVDMLALQIRGYLSMAGLYDVAGNREGALRCQALAAHIRTMLEQEWYNTEQDMFYTARNPNGSFVHTGGFNTALHYYDVVADTVKRECDRTNLHMHVVEHDTNVETLSHLPDTFFAAGDEGKGLFWLKKVIDPTLFRREYPEVSFATISAYAHHLVGIRVDARTNSISIKPASFMKNFTLHHYPVVDGTLSVVCENGVAKATTDSKMKIIET